MNKIPTPPTPIRTITDVDKKNYTKTITNFYEDGSYCVKVHYEPDPEDNWTEQWYDNLNKLHRDSELGAAYIVSCPAGNGNVVSKEVYYIHGEVKRTDDGPTHVRIKFAYQGYHREKHSWTKNGVKHRTIGPAVMYKYFFTPNDPEYDSDKEVDHRLEKSIWYKEGVKQQTVNHISEDF